MSTFSNHPWETTGLSALLASNGLDVMDYEDAIVSDDTAREPTHHARPRVIGYRDKCGPTHYVARGRARSKNWAVLTFPAIGVSGCTMLQGRIAEPTFLHRDVTGHPAMAQRLARELGRLKTGWAGPDTVAPSMSVILDILTVSAYLPQEAEMPEAEVDPEDGSVILRWIDQSASSSFSLTFLGKGNVTGFCASENSATPAWKYRVTDANRLAVRLCDDAVRSLIVG